MEKLYAAAMSDVLHQTGWRERLRQILADRNLSKRKVSLDAKLGPGVVHSWLVEGKDPSIENLLAVCGVLDISLIYLVKGYDLTPEAEEVLGLLQSDATSRDAVLALLRARQK